MARRTFTHQGDNQWTLDGGDSTILTDDQVRWMVADDLQSHPVDVLAPSFTHVGENQWTRNGAPDNTIYDDDQVRWILADAETEFPIIPPYPTFTHIGENQWTRDGGDNTVLTDDQVRWITANADVAYAAFEGSAAESMGVATAATVAIADVADVLLDNNVITTQIHADLQAQAMDRVRILITPEMRLQFVNEDFEVDDESDPGGPNGVAASVAAAEAACAAESSDAGVGGDAGDW